MRQPTLPEIVMFAIIGLAFLGWRADCVRLRAEAVKWRCSFELIDPIRAEAEVPLSDCCKDWLKQ